MTIQHYHFYAELQHLEPLMETFTPSWRSTRPWMYGEFCDSDAMRLLADVRNSRKTPRLWWEADHPVTNPISLLKPDFHLGHYEERLKQSGMAEHLDAIVLRSKHHALVHRKITIEQTRSFPEISGYTVTSLRDVPIATSGILDDDLNPKFRPSEFASFNQDVMLLPAYDLRREWIGADRVSHQERYHFIENSLFRLHLLLSNYSDACIEHGTLVWQLASCDGTVWLHGSHQLEQSHPIGSVLECAYLSFQLPSPPCTQKSRDASADTKDPTVYLLRVTLCLEQGGVSNHWPIFVLPSEQPCDIPIELFDPCDVFPGLETCCSTITHLQELAHLVKRQPLLGQVPRSVVVTSHWNQAVQAYAEQGGRVFCLQRGPGSIPTELLPFWREGFCYSEPHPILRGCLPDPNNWQDDLRYFSLATDTAIQELALEQMGFVPVDCLMRRYDCRTFQRHSYLAEYKLRKGRVIISTLRFEGGMGKQPSGIANSPFAQFLLRNMVSYLANTAQGDDKDDARK